MAAGLPVVSTFHAGIPEVVEHESSGLLVQERDIAGLSAALKLLATNSGLRAEMGQRGQSIIRERHDIGILNDRLLGIYRELIAHCR
jgi:colanic acid/amylovoran biosynthesis glycosyltransferase